MSSPSRACLMNFASRSGAGGGAAGAAAVTAEGLRGRGQLRLVATWSRAPHL